MGKKTLIGSGKTKRRFSSGKAAALLTCLLLLAGCVSPGAGVPESPAVQLEAKASDEKRAAFGDVQIPEVSFVNSHSLPEDARSFLPPIESCYGTISPDEPQKVKELIALARFIGLLEKDEPVAFDPGADFYRGQFAREIEYYFDGSILAILWKENIDGMCCSFAEIKLADPSQFRRKLADDTFESHTQLPATVFAAQTNAVVALNADYYRYRRGGIFVFERELLRFNTDVYLGEYRQYNCVDTLFVNADGDFLYWNRGEAADRESMERFIRDNDVLFSVAFGPVLIRDGQPLTHTWYPLGEINEHFSRAGIGQIDRCHYLYMALSFGDEAPAWTVDEFAAHFARKPVRSAYCLDGGRTAELVFRGTPYNHVDYDDEREISDILFFVTAISED